MRFLKSVPCDINYDVNPVTGKYEFEIDLEPIITDGCMLEVVTSGYATYPVKLPFVGTLPVKEFPTNIGISNLDCSIQESTLVITEHYPNIRNVVINVYGDDTFKYYGEVKQTVIDMFSVGKIVYAGTPYTVQLSAGNNVNGVTLRLSRSFSVTSFYCYDVLMDDNSGQIYRTNAITFNAVKNTQGEITGYTATVPRYMTAYVD